MAISPITLKLLADNKIDTRAWQPDELEKFQARYSELTKEYITKLQELDVDGMKAALELAVMEVELAASENVQAEASTRLIAALEVLCNERIRVKNELDKATAEAKAEKEKAEKEFKDKVGRKLIKVQTLTVNGEATLALKYNGEAATSIMSSPLTADKIEEHLETIPALKGNVKVSGPTDDEIGGKVFEIKYQGKLKRNFIPLALASGTGPGTISLGY